MNIRLIAIALALTALVGCDESEYAKRASNWPEEIGKLDKDYTIQYYGPAMDAMK